MCIIRYILALLVAGLTTLSLLAQATPARVMRVSRMAAGGMTMPMVAPLFLEDGRFSSTLTMVNNAERSVQVKVSLVDMSGNEVAARDVDVLGNTSQAIRVRDLFAPDSKVIGAGSVLVTPDTEAAEEMIIGAQLSITANSAGYSSYIEEELEMPMDSTIKASYRGTALNVERSPILALRSLSAKPQTVMISCLSERPSATAPSRLVTLAAAELQIVSACDASLSGEGVIAQQIDAKDRIVNSGSVGISISSTAAADELAVFGFVPHEDKYGSFFSALDLEDPMSWASASTVFAGVPLGRTPMFPGAKFQSQIGVSNFGDRAAEVTVTVARTNAASIVGSSEEAHTASNEVARFVLRPKASRTVSLPVIHDLPLTNSVLVRSTGTPGQVTSKFISWSDSNVRTIELVGKDSNTPQNGGGHPWSIKDGAEATLLLFNHTGDARQINVNVIYSGKRWQQEYLLPPMQTDAISINDLIANSTPDKSGSILPRSLNHGTVSWGARHRGEATGRLLESLPVQGLARSFSCGACPHMTSVAVINPPDNHIYARIGDVDSLGPILVQESNACNTSCGGLWNGGYSSAPDSWLWSPYSNGIVTLVNGAIDDVSDWNVIAVGSSAVTYKAWTSDQIPRCTANGSATTTGYCATPINFTASETNLSDGSLKFHYTFASSTGNPADLASCQVGETVWYPGSSNPYYWPLSMVSHTANPTLSYGAGNNMFMDDTQFPPTSYLQPYVPAEFLATQRIQWSCPCYQSGAWQSFISDQTIDRKLFQDTDGHWKYRVTKSGSQNTVVIQ